MSQFKTADLCDTHGESVTVASRPLQSFGRHRSFCGAIQTVKVDGDFLLIKQSLSEQGNHRVLVVDGGGALDHALCGDRLAVMAADNLWAGVIINGCIRDSADISEINLGVMALSTCPRRPAMQGDGETGLPVSFIGLEFVPGHYVYADADGIIVSESSLI